MKTQKNTFPSGMWHSCRFILAALAAATSATLPAAVPQISGVTMAQDTTRLVTITYTLADAPAVVTVDVQTNNANGGWASIGGEAVWNATGDVWKKVETGSRTITWRPDHSWPDHKIADGGARAVVTAWALDNTPDYMAVDVSAAAQPDTQTYYPAADFVPGGVTNGLYKTTMLLMRKIMAKDVKWTMGSVAESGRNATREPTHNVKLDGNYYIGVYEITQTQWQQVTGYNPSNFTTDRTMRPVEQVSYTDIRQGKGTASTAASATGGVYPAEPYGDSFLGILRDKTGLDFDLPSEAQWEFAARAGNGEGYWSDGSAMRISSNKDVGLDLLGRYQYNGGKIGTNSGTDPAANCEATNGTAIVGSYLPNAWGLYDVHGNVLEWCLDWYADDITALNGAVNTASGAHRVIRGGGWYNTAGICRPAFRASNTPTSRNYSYGFRVLCSAGLR
ncbi:MAG: formylglycine-generating enzyme family protein [Kiritimatiellae bacterium]|nr:formylglycine-generating enzyme family protein [Kiritimatiellia bacterium]